MSDKLTRSRIAPPTASFASLGDGRYRMLVDGDVDDEFGGEIVRLVSELSSRELVAQLTVDLTGVSVFGTAGLRALRSIRDMAATNGFRVDVDGASNTTCRVLEIGELSDLVATPAPASAPATVPGLIASDAFSRVVAQGVLNGRDAVVITTPEVERPGPTIVFVNRAFTDLFGHAADEAIGQTPRMLQGPLTDRWTLDRMKEHLQRGDVFEDDVVNYRADGQPFVMSWKVIPVAAEPDQDAYFMSMQHDVTEERLRKRFDLATDLLDTQLRIGAIRLDNPTVPIEQTMTTLLSVQTMMLGAGVATLVLTDRNERDHRFSTAITDAENKRVDAVLHTYGREPLEDADVDLSRSSAHMRIDTLTVPESTYRYSRLVLSGVHPDWLRLADVDYHRRLLHRVFSHNP